MAQIVKATEAVRSFSDIINRVYYKGESFDIQKGNNIVARITPAHPIDKPKKTLKEFFEHAPTLDADDAEQFKKVVYKARQKYDFKRDDKWK
ncbi:antitoxin [Rickettsia endosymbiont of Gonocerus acuteangulatus]|uniref:antitoxin n=1 Tax=Rickettsia endosymbiont of Gonocerus acuteangulatus TaxID=3066266 RepID=UPI00313333B6